MKLIFVLLAFALMLVVLKYRFKIYYFTGDIAWAEKYLGSGGTVKLIILIAVLIFLGTLMYALGTLQSLAKDTVGKLF